MRRSESDLRNNHHSLNRKQSPLYLHSSKADSLKIRKMSTASLKENIDLEKLIMDIKISPAPQCHSQNIQTIYSLLKMMEANPLISDEVNAVNLLMQSIENKLNMGNRQKYRPPSKVSTNKDSFCSDSKEMADVSPIKQMNDDTSSRILYTNFSIKQLEKSLSEEASISQSSQKGSMKVAVSKFEECESNAEVEKLNDEIKYLEKLLVSKTKGANPTELTLFKKKSCRY